MSDHHGAYSYQERLVPPESLVVGFLKGSQIFLVEDDPMLPPLKAGIKRIVISCKSKDCMCWRDSGPPTMGINEEDPESLRNAKTTT